MKRSLLLSLSLAMLGMATAGAMLLSPAEVKAEGTFTDLSLDFSEETQANSFTGYGGGQWNVSDGKLVPGGSWATAYVTEAIPLTENIIIRYDFNVGEDASLGSFGSGLIYEWENRTGLITWVRAYNETSNLATMNGSMAGETNAWMKDAIGVYFDGKDHTMTISINNQAIAFSIDGAETWSGTTEAETAYFALGVWNNLTDISIDNLYIEKVSSSLGTSFDFSKLGHANAFTGYGGTSWTVAEGKFSPTASWSTTYYTTAIDLTQETVISYDFNVGTDASAGSFASGLVYDWTTRDGLINWVRGYNETADLATMNGSLAGVVNAWLNDTLGVYFDGKDHAMKIEIYNKDVIVSIDGTQTWAGTATQDSAYLAFGISDNLTSAYVDNVKVDTLAAVVLTEAEDKTADKQICIGYNVVDRKGTELGLYAVGESISATSVATPVYITMYMNYGASVRIVAPTGLRWTTNILNADLEALEAMNVTYALGTLITSEGSDKSVDIARTTSGYVKGNYFVYSAALTAIKEENYSRMLQGTGYIDVTYASGAQVRLFAVSNNNERSYEGIINAALSDYRTKTEGNYVVEVIIDGETRYYDYTEEQVEFLLTEYEKINAYKAGNE